MISRFWHKNKIPLLFLSPWLIGVTILAFIPMIASLYLAFTNYNMLQAPTWVGLENFNTMLNSDSRFFQSLKVTFIYVFLGVPLQLIVAFSLATVLNRGVKGLSFFRAIYYVPSILGPSVAIAVLWRQLFGMEGIFNDFVSIFGLEPQSWISDPSTSLYTLIVLLVWQFGSPMVIFLAGLKQIPSDLYEAAAIDGAGPAYMLFKITLPLITPIIFFNLVMQIIGAFQAFTPAYIIGGGTGGTLDSTLFYTLYLYIKAFTQFEMGYASAMAWFLLVIIATFTGLLFLTARKWVHYQD
ncbi:carbohydrate ABC transporter permease [Gracilibacillus kekensis]|uniref:Carbohydrate ABC transporter membrane protein 1, CUT1 family n=1 Tax=Gracilibacillus kekensis TaxID=1027249 RepID=A0A1M7Q8C4_9BACI|nr:sugar ABC transporter permease [Gracilibacillus kekensis]SHN26776.1 carbohydrate ABC transporter membrane protein 1, CUT1 family [Gracilibacillus kekensis]